MKLHLTRWQPLSLATAIALSLFACWDAAVTAQSPRNEPSTALPDAAAAMLKRFESARYRQVLWVRAGASAGGDGSQARPFKTINDALARAKACTEVRVMAGVYNENVRFQRNLDGARDCPIRLVSFEGAGRARIVAPDDTRSAIAGGGSENIMVEGFSIRGGKNGVQFGQNGRDWSDLARNIVIRFNAIADPVDDGVKINGAETVVIAHNAISGGKDEAIDLFGTIDAAVLRNRLGPMATPSGALTIKAGSRSILVSGNLVSGISTQGIVVGGRTGAELKPRPGFEGFEADNVRIHGNRVENVGKVPLAFLGATNSQAWNNQLSATAPSPVVAVSDNLPKKGSKLIESRSIRAWKNRYITTGRIARVSARASDIQIEQQTEKRWDMPTGPDMAAFKP